jgi:hypothetical protein
MFREYTSVSLKNAFQARIGGPRGKLAKINAGEKEINCSTFGAKQLVAENKQDENCAIAN